jgi:hypothetical protein
MKPRPCPPPASRESGALTILAALALLALLTVAAFGMARNSLQEAFASASTRQGSMVANEADTGLDWACFWMVPANLDTGGSAAIPGSQAFSQAIAALVADPASAGVATTLAPVTTNVAATHTDSFTLDVTRMGKLEGTGNDQRLLSDWRLWPDVWSIRSTGTADYGGGLSYVHSREAWMSTPIRSGP